LSLARQSHSTVTTTYFEKFLYEACKGGEKELLEGPPVKKIKPLSRAKERGRPPEGKSKDSKKERKNLLFSQNQDITIYQKEV